MEQTTQGVKLSDLPTLPGTAKATDLIETVRVREDDIGRYKNYHSAAASGVLVDATVELAGKLQLATPEVSAEGLDNSLEVTSEGVFLAIRNMLEARMTGENGISTFYNEGTGVLTVSAAGSCIGVISAIDDIDPNVDSMGLFVHFPNDSSAGLTWDKYKCVFAENSAAPGDGTYPVVCNIDWTTCNNISSPQFINAALDVRNGGEIYNTPFSFPFTNVPSDETICKAFVCGTRGGSSSDFGTVTLPGGAAELLQNYGPGPLNSSYNRLRWFVVRNNLGTLTGAFIDF